MTFSTAGAPAETHLEDSSKRENIIADHPRLVRYIKIFGFHHLKICARLRRPEGTAAADPGTPAATLNELGKRIRLEEGIKFGVHAHMWRQCENRREIDSVMDHLEQANVYFILDTGHMNLSGAGPVELAKHHGNPVIEFHLKDTKPEHRGGSKQ